MSDSEQAGAPKASESLGLLTGVAAVLRDTLHLAGLETRQAAIALAWVLALGLLVALLLISTWLMLNFALGWWLSGQGWSVQGAFLLLAGADLLGAILCAALLMRLARRLSYPATARQLQRIADMRRTDAPRAEGEGK